MKKIEKMYAVLSDDGIFAIKSEGTWYPIVFTDANKVSKIPHRIQDYSNLTDKELTLVEFTTRKDIKVIKPNDKR